MLKNGIWLFIIALLLFLMFLPAFERLQEKISRNKDLDAKIIQLRSNKKELTQERKRLDDDPSYLERVAREKMGLVKEGEVVYRLESVNNSEK